MSEELFYKKPFDFFMNKIKNGEHFKHVRFNDGELYAIQGKLLLKPTIDGHLYYLDMGVELKDILLNYSKSDHYFLASAINWYSTNKELKAVIDEHKNLNPNISFVDADFIRDSHLYYSDKYIMLLDELKGKNVTIIGANRFTKLRKFLDFDLIEIPSNNCYSAKDDVIEQIRNVNETTDNNYYLFSASMPTNIIIDAFKDDTKNTYLSWGSTWDTFFVSPEYNKINKRSDVRKNYDQYKKIYKDYLI